MYMKSVCTHGDESTYMKRMSVFIDWAAYRGGSVCAQGGGRVYKEDVVNTEKVFMYMHRKGIYRDGLSVIRRACLCL